MWAWVRSVGLVASAGAFALGTAANADIILPRKDGEGPDWALLSFIAALLFIGFALWNIATKEIEIRHLREHLPVLSLEPDTTLDSWGYARSINGHFGSGFISVTASGNNPGPIDERITDIWCELRQEYLKGVLSRCVAILDRTDFIDWPLQAKGPIESRHLLLAKTLTDYRKGSRLSVGSQLRPVVIASLGSPRRRISVKMPRVEVRGPHTGEGT